jgi:hypothetical protein
MQDIFRLALLYAHLIAFAISLSAIARADWRLLSRGFAALDTAMLQSTTRVVVPGLIALLLTGAGIAAIDTGLQWAAILERPKLMAKLCVVSALLANGIALHALVFPQLAACRTWGVESENRPQRGQFLPDLQQTTPKSDRPLGRKSNHPRLVAVLMCLSGAISSVSWLYAGFLGIAKPLADRWSWLEFMMAYGLLVAIGFVAALLLAGPQIARLLDRQNQDPTPNNNEEFLLVYSHSTL